ncbi:MAG: hypothetical protein OWV35_06955, partial [Firmicutes bacterium]|nr:hypothetical protein [Bacillota bacterium]
MQWIINGLVHFAANFFYGLAAVFGYGVNALVTTPLLLYVVVPLLHHTIFEPVTLGGAHLNAASTLVTRSIHVIWATTAAVSGAVALMALLWGTFQRTAPGLASGKRWGDLGEGMMLYAFVLVGALPFLGLLPVPLEGPPVPGQGQGRRHGQEAHEDDEVHQPHEPLGNHP